jgi:hypothetical protein
VIEVLSVEHCPNFPAALALVQRVAAELGLDLQVRTTMIGDQAAAEGTRFPGSPTVRVDGRDVDPDGEYTLECRLYGTSITLPATPRSSQFARPCCGQPVQPDRRLDADQWLSSRQHPSSTTCLSCHPIFCRMRFDHPDDHPDDPSVAVGSRLDRQRIQPEQARSALSRPDRRRASVS